MQKLSDMILAVTLALFAVSLSISLTLVFKPLYYFDIGYLNIAGESGYPAEEIRRNYDVLIDYNLSPKETELSFPSFSMSQEGREHFREVRAIFQGILRLLAATAALSAVGILWKRKRREYGYLLAAGLLSLSLPLAALAVMAAGWDNAFVLFHRLLFRNDYWLFDPATDPVIDILPDTFFLHCAGMIVLLIIVCAAVFLLRYRSRRARHLQNLHGEDRPYGNK